MSFIIETERLGMREYRPDDAEELFVLCTDARITRYIVGESAPSSVEQMRQMLAEYPDYAKHGFGRWACIHKASGRLIGFSGLKYIEEFDGEVDLGYRFFPEFWGQGLATEAGLPCVRYGFDVLGLEGIIGLVLPENIASVRVLEKCGMRFERFVSFGFNQKIARYAIERCECYLPPCCE